MTELVLVRHGETEWHAENRYAGSSDIALTPRGVAQAEELARWAGKAELDAVLTSPLRRARDTSGPAAAAAGLEAVVDRRLVEVDFGAGEGLTRAEMAARFPEGLAAFRAAPASSPLPGGETGEAAVGRARPVLDEACRTRPDGRVLVVAHQTLLRLLLCDLLGLPLDRYRTVFPRLDPATLTVVVPAESGPAALRCLNAPCG
ncbi:histidine phosphatase family protein [Actinomycetospora endophytica]|uniref:Histidine phosphatase family protein n=1 Tax=Actinomycetospora endophytica TaxID=2291215 RepID=A0ABS8PJC6_9PSEU|nr:histidine phosphatase family protein [Actinomycetospora endophytica]MCD2198163.1 histidine phosphatase family protein [Actinomycetospora endophytica]